MAVDRYGTGHDMQSAKQATRTGPLEEEGHLGRLRAYRKDPCERRALTLVAEAFRALSGLGFCSLGS